MTASQPPVPTASDEASSTSLLDVAVIGGGAAGLSAALVLARSRRSVVVIDAGRQRNAPADHMHNYLGREGTPPLELVAIGRREVESYGARIVDASVVAVETVGTEQAPRFTLRLDDGSELTARRVVLATGVRDTLPDVEGLADRWGRDVLHCPYCHGWEVRDQRIGVLATTAAGMHQTGLFRQLSDRVTFIAHDVSLAHADRARLAARGVKVAESAARSVIVEDDALAGVRLADGSTVVLDALVVASFPDASCDVAAQLGVATKDVAMGETVMARALDADPNTGVTTVPGVVVVGNASAPMATVIAASASGTQVGAFLNAMLVEEDTRVALRTRRAEFREQQPWEERYADRGDAERVWSGRTNPQLEARVAGLAPGRALELGCGEGADAIWLARQGWEVTGVDFAAAGLARAARAATEAGVAGQVSWRQEDLRTWQPDGSWDLIVSHYLHLERGDMLAAVGRWAGSVAPGGTLLVVGHDLSGSPDLDPDDLFVADDLVPALGAGWDVTTEVVDRVGTGMGEHVVVPDQVLVAVRQR